MDRTRADWTDQHHTRSDARMVAKAAREGWAVPGKVKRAIVAGLADAIDGADGRMLASIAAAFVAMDRADTAAERLELDRLRTEPPGQITVRVVCEDQP